MRASELLGTHVVTSDGHRLGYVTGLQCDLDRPTRGPMPAPRLCALTVAPRRLGAGLGYQQPGQRGPWLVHRVVSALHRGMLIVDWDDVDRLTDGEIRLRAGYGDRNAGTGQG